jgi:glycosyltransferase involved in cell wall biosynthesis
MFWLWESGEFPENWLPALNLADEIWTPSEFSGAAVRKATDKPVTVMPYYIEVPINENIDRDYFKLPEDQTLFLCSYDSGSVMFRKNPDGVINAYKRAFPSERPDCGIVIKVGGAPKDEVRELKAELSAYRNVYFITDYLSRVDMNSLIACCDAYISLHRAEGFGLVCAEAMYLGKPVVATNWSANTEFMNSGNACLVDYELKPLEEAIGPFKAGTMWAEPDAAQAAMCVRRVYEDAGYRAAIGSAAAESIRRELNIEKSARAVRTRLTQLIRGQLCRGVG